MIVSSAELPSHLSEGIIIFMHLYTRKMKNLLSCVGMCITSVIFSVGKFQPIQCKFMWWVWLISCMIIPLYSPIVLKHVIIHGCLDFDGKGGCRPYLKIYQDMKLIHTTRLQ